jgi:hypothetical protein
MPATIRFRNSKSCYKEESEKWFYIMPLLMLDLGDIFT